MKYLLFILYFLPLLLECQVVGYDNKQMVHGIMTSSNGAYLILDKGFIEINETNLYTEYYRRIYNDSTIVNPNTIIKQEFDLNIIPFILPDAETKKINFSEPLNLGMFLQLNDSGTYNLTSYADEIIDSLIHRRED